MPRWRRNDLLIAASLFAVTVLARVPFRSLTLNEWDSVNFALGLEHYDVASQQPHPPGYIVYIGAGRLLNFLFHDANNTLVAISVLSGAAAVALAFLIGRSIFDRATGLAAAAVILFSPLAWFYSEVAMTYETGLLMSLISVWFLYNLFFHRRYPLAAAAFLGLAAGVRQDICLFAWPFFLFGLILIERRRALAALAVLAVATMAWLAPLLALSGGISAYLEAGRVQYNTAVAPYTLFSGGGHALASNLRGIWQASFWFYGLSGIMLIFPLIHLFRVRSPRRVKRGLFLLALSLPPLLYFLIYQIGIQGYMLLAGGPLALLLARAVTWEPKDDIAEPSGLREPSGRNLPSLDAVVLLSVLLLLNAGLFLKADSISFRFPFTEGPVASIFGPFSSRGIRAQDARTRREIDAVRRFSPNGTAVAVGALADWRKLMYYLPEYHVLMIGPTGSYTDAWRHYCTVARGSDIKVNPEVRRVLYVNLYPGKVSGLALVPGSGGRGAQVLSAPFSGSMAVNGYRLHT